MPTQRPVFTVAPIASPTNVSTFFMVEFTFEIDLFDCSFASVSLTKSIFTPQSRPLRLASETCVKNLDSLAQILDSG